MSTTIADALTANSTPVLPDPVPDLTQPRRRIDAVRVVIVDNLLRTEDDLSDVARAEPGFDSRAWLKLDRYIAGLAIPNIEHNVRNLADRPEVKILHLSEANAAAIGEYDPDAVVLSGTLRDFDFYSAQSLKGFFDFVVDTQIPVLGICGGHQLVGQAFGTEIITLDRKLPSQRRANRVSEYQYRYLKIVEDDPIFHRIDDRNEDSNPQVRGKQRILRVWQNHGLMIDRIPEGFVNLAAGYLCPIQMLVRRTTKQLIYTVQFHIEKSFEDWGRPRKFWDHHVESRDGRIIFENFLVEALKHRESTRGAAPIG